MNTKDLIRLGVPVGEPIALAHEFIQSFIAQGNDGAQLEAEISTSWPIHRRFSPMNCGRRWRARFIARRSRRARNSRRGVSGARASKPRR
jgi:hypothetical protein